MRRLKNSIWFSQPLYGTIPKSKVNGLKVCHSCNTVKIINTAVAAGGSHKTSKY
jgi:hypothetical protein